MRPRMGEARKNRDLAIDLGCSGAGGVERGRQKASTLSVGGWQARHGCDRSGLLLGVHGAEPPIAAIGCKSLLAGHLRPKLRICPDKSRFRKLSGTFFVSNPAKHPLCMVSEPAVNPTDL